MIRVAGAGQDTAANLGIVIGVVDRGGQSAVGREVDVGGAFRLAGLTRQAEVERLFYLFAPP